MMLGVLVAEQPVLAGVRVEPADRDPRDVEEPTQRRVRQLDHVENTLRSDPVDRLAERTVRAHVRDGEVAAREHHRHLRRAAQRRDELGVADEAGIAELRRLLVHRHRDDARHLPVEGIDGGPLDVVACRCATRAGRARPAGVGRP